MIKKGMLATVGAAALIGAGCATMGGGSSRTSNPPAPAGPVQTASTERNVIPAGTSIPIRTNERISTQDAGGRYTGVVAQDVVNRNYDVLIPRGSPAELVVIDSSGGGAVGTKTIELAVRSVTVNGRTLTVASSGSEQRGSEGLGRNERTATMVGGGAVLGTVIGAIAGGASGAAIGAAVGAAGGAATQVLTRGKEVEVPAETVLNFQLQQALQVS
ncbi:MAG: hypothetical protein KIT09_32625 [Bryobacteraceae bacterium]|nr:hypothetical protein [Bryobacteraceae bacterium]